MIQLDSRLKRLILVLVAVAGMAIIAQGQTPASGIKINEENFPDENFRNYVLKECDRVTKDSVLQELEISRTFSMHVVGKNIKTLKGIEHFTKLESLNCYSNKLTDLDISSNTALTSLNCQINQLTSLDVSMNTSLKKLECWLNQLTALEVSNNTALETLKCYSNQLTALDVSNNTKLTTLDCHSNQLSTLNVSNNALKTLDCSENQLETLNFSDNDALTSLNCSSNQLTALDVSQNTALSSLNCSSNKLSTLDVSNNTMLTTLDCSSNQLATLNFSDNDVLTSLNCSSNQFTALDVSQNTALSSLSCSSNQLTSLDVSKNTALTSLNCSSNQFTSLRDVSINAALTSLNCSNNKLTSLDVSENTTLKSLNCSSNQFTTLDVSNYTALETLNCSSNNKLSTLDVSKNTELTNLNCAKSNLSKLDVSKNTKLSELRFNDCKKLIELIFSENNTELTNLYCYENNLKGDRMDSLVKVLPKVVNGNLYVLNAHAYSPHENNHIMKSQVDSVAKKGWKVFKQVDYTGKNWQEYAGSDEQPSYFMVMYEVDFNGGFFEITPWKEGTPVGAEITIEVWPGYGYKLKSIRIYRHDDYSIYIEIPIVDNKTEFKFNKPAFDADVRVKFEKQSSDDAGSSTGLFNIRCENLSVFPNPTQGVLWVSVPELAEGTAAEVHVYNTSGQLLQRVPAHGASACSAASRLSIDLSSYPAGMYIIRVGNAVAKVVKQ